MTETIRLTKKNECMFRVDCDMGVLYELDEATKFFVKGAKFMPKFKAKVWDGYVHLTNVGRRETYVGLYDDIVEFCRATGYRLELESSPYGLPGETDNVDMDELRQFIQDLKCSDKEGNVLEVREYQIQAVYEALTSRRKIILASTGSGKSLIQYILMRWLLAQELQGMMIVPTKALVLQMLGDFRDYSTVNGFQMDDVTHFIMSGQEKSNKKPITITTWQSIHKLSAPWFQKFDFVMCDEVHLAKGQSIQNIMGKCTEAAYRFGLTGSLDNSQTNVKVIQANFGSIIRVTTTKKLMEEGFLTDISIKCILLDYSNETKILCKDFDYQKEIDFLCAHEKRNKFIRNLALSLDGNTLILYNYVDKHGQVLYDLIKEKADPERKVFFIHGDVDVRERDAVRGIIEKSKDSITVASMGTFSTGINVKRIHNVILAAPTRSVIRILQSIGRGLRLAGDKTVFNLFDIADNLARSKKKKNYTYDHFVDRLNIYHGEDFPFKIIDVRIEQ